MGAPFSVFAAERYLACTRRIVRARGLSEVQRFLLFNCVITYLQLDEAARQELDERLASRRNREVQRLMMTWAEKMEGVGMKKLLLRQLEARFP